VGRGVVVALSARGVAGARLASAARITRDFLLPAACPACDRLLDEGDAGVVCGRCWARLERLRHPQCERCGHPGRVAPCAWCQLLPPYVRAVRSVCWMHRGPGGAIVHALKYNGWHAIANGMAERMARLSWPADVIEERAAILPVPLAKSRLRERGFNQSERLASALARHWSLPVSHALVRSRATGTQTRLTPEQRLANVSGAFRVDPATRHSIKDMHVVLIDDVVTTAATLNACAASLIAGGARIVSYLTFGRAPAAGDRL
jgi:ComF family protein